MALYDWYLYYKGKAFANFLESIRLVFNEYTKTELSNINTQSIIVYTSLLLDRIHWQDNYWLELQLEFPDGYYLTNVANQSVLIKDSLTHIVTEPTTEFVWQAYLLSNSDKVFHDIDCLIVAFCDLLWMYSEDYLLTFKWEPDINVFLEPKVFLAENYARVECCWINENELDFIKRFVSIIFGIMSFN